MHQGSGHTEVEAEACAHQVSGHTDVLPEFVLQLPNTVERVEAVSNCEPDANVSADCVSAAELPRLTLCKGRGPKDPISLCVEREGTQEPRGAATPY